MIQFTTAIALTNFCLLAATSNLTSTSKMLYLYCQSSAALNCIKLSQ
jgi:hypothetical protein